MMIKILFTCLMLFSLGSVSVYAAIDPPILTFEKKVEIVVRTRKDPRIFEMKIEQNKTEILLTLVVDRNVDRALGKIMAFNAVYTTKNLSLDDPSTDQKILGKGLYDYTVVITRADGINLLRATKPRAKKSLRFDLEPAPALTPLMPSSNRAGATSQSLPANR